MVIVQNKIKYGTKKKTDIKMFSTMSGVSNIKANTSAHDKYKLCVFCLFSV